MESIKEFADGLICDTLKRYDIDRKLYNEKFESLPSIFPNLAKCFIALYLAKHNLEYSFELIRPILKVNFEW